MSATTVVCPERPSLTLLQSADRASPRLRCAALLISAGATSEVERAAPRNKGLRGESVLTHAHRHFDGAGLPPPGGTSSPFFLASIVSALRCSRVMVDFCDEADL